MNKLLLFISLTLLLLCGNSRLNAQIVTIPDANFKAELVADTMINTNQDTEIDSIEAAVYTGTISVVNKTIADLTGIEAFVMLDSFMCDSNQITTMFFEITK